MSCCRFLLASRTMRSCKSCCVGSGVLSNCGVAADNMQTDKVAPAIKSAPAINKSLLDTNGLFLQNGIRNKTYTDYKSYTCKIGYRPFERIGMRDAQPAPQL